MTKQSCVGLLEPIQHQINHDTRDRHVEPDRQRPAGDAPVRVESFSQRTNQSDQRQRYYGDGENGVGDEDREIDRANPTLAFETDRPDLEVIN